MSFRDRFNPDELTQFEEWARHQREVTLAAMADSAMVCSVYPTTGAFDVDYALQVGASVLLDKPLLVLVSPGLELPPKLRAVADEIVEVDVDQVDLGGPEVAKKVKAFIDEHVER